MPIRTITVKEGGEETKGCWRRVYGTHMWSIPHSGGCVLIEAHLKLLSFLFWLAFEWRRKGNVKDGRSGVRRSTGLSLPHEHFGQAHLTAHRLSLLTASTPRDKRSFWSGWTSARRRVPGQPVRFAQHSSLPQSTSLGDVFIMWA